MHCKWLPNIKNEVKFNGDICVLCIEIIFNRYIKNTISEEIDETTFILRKEITKIENSV